MFKKVTLELSLKPFKKTDCDYIRSVCRDIFKAWHPLLKEREIISVMLWASDGSEILDYDGNLSTEFEWCRFVGTANLPYRAENEPLETSLHRRKQDYIENAPIMTYGILKNIIKTLKDEGARAFPRAKILVGETFDIGPEFSISDFKYNRHLEITSGARLDKFGFVNATARLLGDTRRYAAYPYGIPDGTPFGTFLGKQWSLFARDMGFDYLWLSNGLGFSANPWDKTGKIFDGERYHPEKLDATRRQVFEFWRLFREACPDIPLEVRGTNNSVGIDYASDGVPLYDIYNSNLGIVAPPNSPWAAINDNFGLEIMGHMTRTAELPSECFPFRYYLHDPWWINSPWYDRYGGTPCDIYLPMAISRITADGATESANTLNILSIDNSYGTMPDCSVNECVPHLLKAEKDAPDEPGPLVWIYPMREYTTASGEEMLNEMNLADKYVESAINDGLPLCTVVSTDAFSRHDKELYRGKVLISPVPCEKATLDKLCNFAEGGIGVIIYGTSEALRRAPKSKNVVTVDVAAPACMLREALSNFGISVTHAKRDPSAKPPTLAISRYDGAYMFSACNSNTTTDTKLKMPLGAPVFIGGEAIIEDGSAVYRIQRYEHAECRVFVKQKSGVISCRETAPVNVRFRRKIALKGLLDAEVCFFPEKSCEGAVSLWVAPDETPEFDTRFREINDEHGRYLKAQGVSGDLLLLIGHKNTAK